MKNCRLKRIHFKDDTGKYMWGFLLMAKGSMIEFYTQNEDICNEWVTALKRSVVLLDLKDEFKIGKLLGRGFFAKVHLCNRRNDPTDTQYALKTIEK